MKTTILIISAIAICMASIPAASETAYMPFPISGYVFYEDGSACNNPSVTITNITTDRTFPTMTLPSSNYYRADPTPRSDEVNVYDVLRFTVGTGTGSVAVDHSITSSDIATGIFLNVTVGVGGNSVAAITKSGQESIVVPETTPTLTPTVTPSPQSPQESPQESPTPESGPSSVSTRLTSPGWETKAPGFGAVVGAAAIGLAVIFCLMLRRKQDKRR